MLSRHHRELLRNRPQARAPMRTSREHWHCVARFLVLSETAQQLRQVSSRRAGIHISSECPAVVDTEQKEPGTPVGHRRNFDSSAGWLPAPPTKASEF